MGNVHMEATQINYRGGATKMNVEDAIKSAIELTPEQKTNINKIPTIEAAVATKTDQAVIAPEFDAESGIYAIGDLVMHDGKLYEFTTAHETAGDWNPEEITEKTVADEVDTLKSGLMSRTVIVSKREISSNSSITVQLISGHLYIVTLGHPYSEAGMAIVASFTSGSNKVTWIKSKTGVTITEDNNMVLTISSEVTVWYTVVDMGSVYT